MGYLDYLRVLTKDAALYGLTICVNKESSELYLVTEDGEVVGEGVDIEAIESILYCIIEDFHHAHDWHRLHPADVDHIPSDRDEYLEAVRGQEAYMINQGY